MCCIFNKTRVKEKTKPTNYWLTKKNWLVLFLLIALIICIYFFHDDKTMSIPLTIIGLIFMALKYKLDQASYHKSLFEERLQVFNTVHEALVNANKKEKWDEINQKLTPVLNKSYFLFGDKTYAFIRELSDHLITKTYEHRAASGPSSISNEKIEEENIFLNNLLSERELAKKFPELKIDAY